MADKKKKTELIFGQHPALYPPDLNSINSASDYFTREKKTADELLAQDKDYSEEFYKNLDPEFLKQVTGSYLPATYVAPENSFKSIPQPVVGKKLNSLPTEDAVDESVISEEEPIAAYLASLEQQENPLKSKKVSSEIEGYTKKQDELNFMPYAALLDKWTGGGSQLSNAAKSMLDNTQYNKDIVREEQRNMRQQKAQDFNLAKSYNSDLQKVVKPFDEIKRAATPVLNALKGEDGRVKAQKVGQVVTLASKVLGVVGTQTEGDIARIQQETLQMMVGNLQAKFLSDPDADISEEQVKNLVETIEDVLSSVKTNMQDKIKLTRDAYVVGQGLSPENADSVSKLYKEYVISSNPVAGESTSQVKPTPSKTNTEVPLSERIKAVRAKKPAKEQ